MNNLQLIQPNQDNKVTARNLYTFLGLSKNQISRWFKKTIINNEFALEGEDYQGFDTVVEGNTIQDFYFYQIRPA
jgi:anti-repressor protein